MIRYISSILFLILITQNIWAQNDIFNCDNSKRFAQYLFNTGQYKLAEHELERIDFFCETDEVSELFLLKTYRKTGNFQKANLYFDQKFGNKIYELNNNFKTEYIRLLMSQKQYTEVQTLLANNFDFDETFEYNIGTHLLLKEWEKAYQRSIADIPYSNFKIEGLKNIANKSMNAKRKNRFLATLMSAIVPGSGKMYCGYWGDGIVSFLFTASSGYFAYRAFNKYGTNKVYPWLVGGLAVSYYAGNIYGGNRAAIRYNDNVNHGFIHETEDILYSDY